MSKTRNQTGATVLLATLSVGVAFGQDTTSLTRVATDLLERTRARIARMTRGLTKYTCLESVDRAYYVPPAQKIGRDTTEPPATCNGIRPGNTTGLMHAADDRLRLQVAVAGGTEIHSWPDSAAFDSRSVFQMVETGPISTGSFGLYLVDVFENPGTQFYFMGRGNDAGGEVFVYRFRVPLAASHSGVRAHGQARAENGWVTTAYGGSFDIYSATAELARLQFETDELPPSTEMCRARTTIDYHMILIGDGELLLPIRSELETVRANRDDDRVITTFSSCREYLAASSIRFDEDDSPQVNSEVDNVRPSPAPAVLPAGLPIALALTEPVGHLAAAGDRVYAKVIKDVRDPETHRVLVPSGAIAHGRITLMRHRFVPMPGFEVSMSFDKLEMNGTVSPLSLRLDRSKEKPRRENGLRAGRQEFSLPSDAEEGQVTVAFSAIRAIYAVPAHWESRWITR
ncbi:MAG TPA: hypothetical protein VK419_12290 [Bryobacteraceae bacterium]|nr:hypothetical protein [Bryobacteraceae bacterium]